MNDNNDIKKNLDLFAGQIGEFKIPSIGGGGQTQDTTQLPTEGVLKPLEIEDLSGKVPDICQAMKPGEQLLAERQGEMVLCPICHVPFCGSPEAERAREEARLRALRGF